MKTLFALIVLSLLVSCASNNIKPSEQSNHAIRTMSPDRVSYGTLNDTEHDADADAEGGDGDSGQ